MSTILPEFSGMCWAKRQYSSDGNTIHYIGHKMRSRIASFIRQRRWVPFLMSVCLMAAFAISAWIGLNRTIVVFVGIASAASCLLWGYAHRALRVANCPSLDDLHRRQYAETWDTLA